MLTSPPSNSFSSAAGYSTRWTGLLFISLALVVISLDGSILNIAIPSLSRDLGATISDLQWLSAAYTLVFASLLLTTGALSDRFGRKRMLTIGLVVFGLGSLGASFATSAGILIGWRAFLGLGGALIMPSTLSIINVTFPPEERPRAIGLWSGIFGLSVAIGPIVGGLLLKITTWHILFLVNLPVIAVALLGISRYLADSRDEHKTSFDVPGVIFSVITLFLLVYAIIQAGVLGWTNQEVLALFGGAFLSLIVFIVIELRAKTPMLPLFLFRNRSFSGASLALTLVVFSMAGAIFFLSQYLQTVLGYDTLLAGFGTLPLAVGLFVAASISSALTKRFGIKAMVAAGIGVAACSLLYMGLVYKADTPYLLIGVGQFVLGAGLSLAMAPATTSIMSAIPADKSGTGSAMNDTTRELGSALGVAVLGTLMNSTYIAGVQALRTTIPQLPDTAFKAIVSSIQAAHVVAADPHVPQGIAAQIVTTANTAFVQGMSNAMLIGAVLMALSAMFVLLVLPAQMKENDTVAYIVGKAPSAGD